MAFDIPIGAITIFCEASNQPPATRRDVASVILNRARDGRWGKTVAAVCLKRMQFSEWNADPIDNADLERAASAADDNPIMADCAQAMTDTISGVLQDETGGALFYYEAAMKSPPSWAATMTALGQRGPFLFFTDRPPSTGI